MRRGKRGLSLIEVAVSATLVGLLVIFIITIFPSSIQMFRAGREMTAAEDAIRSVTDNFRCINFDNLSTSYDGELSDEIAHYTYHVDVVEMSGYGTPSRLKEMTIRMTWSTRQKQREVVRRVRLVNVPK